MPSLVSNSLNRLSRVVILLLATHAVASAGTSAGAPLPILASESQPSDDRKLLDAVESQDLEQVRLLLESGASVNARDDHGATPLHVASMHNAWELVEMLLKAGAEVNALDNHGRSPLLWAASGGYCSVGPLTGEFEGLILYGRSIMGTLEAEGLETPTARPPESPAGTRSAERLIAAGASVQTRCGSGFTPLHAACASGIVRPILASIGDSRRSSGAFITGDGSETVAALIKAGGSILASRDDAEAGDAPWTPLHWSALRAASAADSARSLLRHHAPVNARTTCGFTPLHFAAASGDADLVNVLIKAGGSLCATAIRGITPLHMAAGLNDNPGFVELFIRDNPMPDARVLDGSNALHVAAGGLPESAELNRVMRTRAEDSRPDRSAVVRALIRAGLDVNATNEAGETPLHAALACGASASVVKALLECGAKVDSRSHAGLTPLHYGASSGSDPDLLSKLIAAGADVRAKSNAGWTPLHFAVSRHDDSRITKALLEAGAEPQAKTFEGVSVLMMCRRSHRSLILNWSRPDDAHLSGRSSSAVHK